MQTIREFLKEAKLLGGGYSRVIVMSDGHVKADYADVKPLEQGTLFDSCLRVERFYPIGNAALVFASSLFPIDGIDRFMGKRRRKWKSYTVLKNGHVSVTLNNGETYEGRDFDELFERLK